MSTEHPQYTTTQNRNHLVAWVSILSEQGVELTSVHLPVDISDKDLETAERHIRSAVNSASRIGYSEGGYEVRRAMKTAIGL